MNGPSGQLAEVWGALTGEPELPVPIDMEGPAEPLTSVFPVTSLGTATIGASLVAAAQLLALRNESRAPRVSLDTRHVATAVRSERYLRVNGELAGAGFAPLSRFWRASDGWIRLHANYPWHRDRLLQVLGTTDDPTAVGAAIEAWAVHELEEAVVAAGGVAAGVRSPEEWRAHPQGVVLDVLPLSDITRIGNAAARARAPAEREAAREIRMLDLTRVIAGPVCTRTLAAHGADVLRIDTPALPEMEAQAIDVLPGKRSAFVDLKSPVGDAEFEHLLDGADVVVSGYRPGSLHQFGLSPAALAARHPGLVVLELSAWGHEGPWAGRRGFDSLVQAACGIAVAESRGGETPGVLPAQALDHATGYLAAAAILIALDRQAREGGTWHIRCSLAQTASFLLRQPRIAATREATGEAIAVDPIDASPYLVAMARHREQITIVRPPGALDGRPLEWPGPPAYLGSASPRWLDAPPAATWASSG